MSEIVEKYEAEKMDIIKMMLEESAKIGKAQYYEVLVDDVLIIKRTNDYKLFSNIPSYVARGTNSLTIKLYGQSAKGWRHILKNYSLIKTQNNELSGLDIDSKISERLKIERERWECDLLKKELESVKEKLEEAEEYIEKLEDRITQIREEKDSSVEKWGSIGSFALEGLVRRFSPALAKIPALAGLDKLLLSDDNESEPSKTNETEASFKKRSTGEKSSESSISEIDKQYIIIIKNMESQLNQEQLRSVMLIFEKMTQEPENIAAVAELLNVKN